MSRYIELNKVLSELGLDYKDYVYIDKHEVAERIKKLPSIDIVRCKCDFGKCHEQGDTLYEPSDWDGGIGFDYIRDIKYCPLCGGLLDGEEQTEREGK